MPQRAAGRADRRTSFSFIRASIRSTDRSPPAQSGDADFCVAEGNFVIGGARTCRSGQRSARFSAVKPSDTGQGSVITLAEAAEYDDTQARDAGIQRLLVGGRLRREPGRRRCAATKPTPRSGNSCSTTSSASPPPAASDFFDILLDAAQKPGNVFTWCNDTANTVMAAIGIDDRGLVVTRGWYRVEAGKCLRPDVTGQPKKLYSFAEAVDADGRAIAAGRQAADLGRRHDDVHAQFQIRNRRSGRLRGEGFDRGRIRCHRSRRAQPGDGPIQVMTSTPRTPAASRGFGDIETWVFDLDNTLYSHHLNLWQQVDERIRDYIADFLKVTRDEAFRLQKDYYKRYGTSMRGTDDRARHGRRTIISISCTRSIIRRSSPMPRSAPRSRNCRAASSFSPTARASMPTP